MRVSRRLCGAATTLVAALGLSLTGLAAGPAAAGPTTGHSGQQPTAGHSTAPHAAGSLAAAPYLYLGWGDPPNPTDLMESTGVQTFTLAFILSDGGCAPAWDGNRPLDGDDQAQIKKIRSAGGEVIPSVGGWAGNKLGEACSDAEALAGAYQQVVDAYDLKAIDVDIESTEFESDANQDRVLGALKILKENNSGLRTIVTFPTLEDGPNHWGERMIQRAAELDADVDTWTIMPFNFGGNDMVDATKKASEGLHDVLQDAFDTSDADTYAMQGISSMNGKTDQGETVTPSDYREMLDYAQEHHIGRFTFWAANRDRPCAGGGGTGSDRCSGIDQDPWEFSKITAEYDG